MVTSLCLKLFVLTCQFYIFNLAQAMQKFYCKNCQYNQHQCFACGKLGSSDKTADTEVGILILDNLFLNLFLFLLKSVESLEIVMYNFGILYIYFISIFLCRYLLNGLITEITLVLLGM